MSEAKPVPVQVEAKRDVWEKIGSVSPLLCGVLISAVGTYCTYTYNQQQIKIQQVQTIGSFIPHLMGNEQSKKAAILALYTMTNSETASKFAQIFASSGTVSALQSMSTTGTEKDKAIANQALSSALQNLAQQNALSKLENDYEKKLVGLKDNGSNSYAAFNMNKLAQIYVMRGQYDLAEPLLNRSLALRTQMYGTNNPEVCDTLRSLAEIYFMTGRSAQAEVNIKEARAIEEKLGLPNQSVANNSSAKTDSQSNTSPSATTGNQTTPAPPAPSAPIPTTQAPPTTNPALHTDETAKSNGSDVKDTAKDSTNNKSNQTGGQLSGIGHQG